MCKRCRSFFSLLGNKDFDTRRKEEAFKKQKEENFSSEVFPWSSFDDEDDDDSEDDSDAMMVKRKVLVVLGGGIAGAKCAEELLRLTEDVPLHRYEIVLIEKSKVLKVFDEETGMMTRTTVFSSQREQRRRLHVLRGEAIKIDGEKQTVTVKRVVDNEDDEDDIDGENNSTKVKVREIHFDQICFAVGARPKRLLETISTDDDDDENDDTIVKYVRDTESAEVLSDALREAFKRSKNGSGSRCGEEEEKKEKSNTNTTRIVVSGNGAVALEIINALDESFLQMVMSFVKAELERAVGGKNEH